jgi:hypothetical protein
MERLEPWQLKELRLQLVNLNNEKGKKERKLGRIMRK